MSDPASPVAQAPIDTPIPAQAPPKRDRVAELLGAGFSQDEVGAWAAERRTMLSSAGFDDQEINDYIGNQPRLSPQFFGRMTQGAMIRPETKPDMLNELYRGAVRGGASLLYSLEDLANLVEHRLTAGSETGQQTAEQDAAALAQRKKETQEQFSPGIPAVTDIGSPRDAAHYLLGKIGETVPAIGEYVVLGVPRMVILGALGGAMKAAEDTGGDKGAVATGAAIGAAAAGAPVPFLNGSVGKGVIDTVAKSALGMGAVGVAQTLAEPLPKAVAGMGYTPPGVEQLAEGAASGAVAGAVFGAAGSLGKRIQPVGGEAHDAPIGGLPRGEDFNAAATTIAGQAPPPEAQQKLERLYAERGLHPAEVAHDAASDVTISQDLLSSNPQLPKAYAPESASGDDFRIPKPGAPPIGMATAPVISRTPAEESILSRLSIGENDQSRPWSWSRFYTAVIDRLNPINEAVKETGQSLNTADDPYKLARLYAGVSGKADHFLNYGTFEFGDYVETGKSLKEIFAPVADDMTGYSIFATALHGADLESKGIKTGLDLADAKQVIFDGSSKYLPVVKEATQYQNKLVRYLQDAGVLSKDSADAMIKEYPFYVPFQRVFGDVVGDIVPEAVRGPGGSTLQASNPIHEIVGSGRRVIDPAETMIRNTYLSIAMAERNAVGTKLVDILGASGASPKGPVDTISIYRNGVKEEHKVDFDLARAMKGLDEGSVDTWLRMMGAPARTLRAGATLTPDFMARNVVRDFTSAVVNSTKGAFTPIDSFRGLMSAIHKDTEYREWLKGGGAQSTMVSLDRQYLHHNLQKLTEDTGLGTRAWNVVRHPIDTLRTLSELSELTTRLGEFQAARRRELAAGATRKGAAQTAAYAAREVTLDFARRGSQTRAMNMITAFWNAQVQGVDRIARAFHDNPIATAAKILGGITLPSILLWMNNHNDPRYKEIPGWERDLFWIVMTDKAIYRIPKPFELGVLFGSGAERLLDALAAQRPGAFSGFVKSVLGALIPSVIPTIAVPLAEQWANRSSFTGRTLIPSSVEKQLPEYEYSPYTTELAKSLGALLGAFPGLRDISLGDTPVASGVARALSSPILIENYIQAWTGGLGKYALQAADKNLRELGVLPDPPKPEDTLADVPFVRAFIVRYPTASAESIQQFYDEYQRNRRYFDAWQAKAKEGDVAAMRHIMDIGGSRMFVQLDGIKNTLAMQSKLVRDIYKNPKMSPEQKRQLIDTTYSGMISVARHGVDVQQRISNMSAH